MTADAEKVYSGTLEYLYSQIPLDKLRLTDSVSEKESEKSIVKCSHDMFVEINEKISAQFTSTGFAIHIKVNGMVYVKNYILGRSNLRLQLQDNFKIINDSVFQNQAAPNIPMQTGLMQGYGSANNVAIRLTQVDETVNVQDFEYSKVISMFPRMGQSTILQYSLEGNFSMLPVKLFPTFVPR